MTRHLLAIGFWLLAWVFSGLIPAAFFAARDRRPGMAWGELAAGIIGAAGFAYAGAVIW